MYVNRYLALYTRIHLDYQETNNPSLGLLLLVFSACEVAIALRQGMLISLNQQGIKYLDSKEYKDKLKILANLPKYYVVLE